MTDLAGARAWYEEAEAIYRQLDDAHGVAKARYGQGMVACQRRDFAAARPLLEASLPALQEANDRWLTGLTLGLLGELAVEEGDGRRATSLHEQSLALHREAGHAIGQANALASLGDLSRLRGEDDRAKALYDEALAIYRAQGDHHLFFRPLRGLVYLETNAGRFDEARLLLVEKLAASRAEGSTPGILTALNDFAYLAAGQGQHRRALRLAAAGLGLLSEPIWPLGTRERMALERALEPARRALGEEAAAAAWAEGQALTLKQAVAEALDEGKGSEEDADS